MGYEGNTEVHKVCKRETNDNITGRPDPEAGVFRLFIPLQRGCVLCYCSRVSNRRKWSLHKKKQKKKTVLCIQLLCRFRFPCIQDTKKACATWSYSVTSLHHSPHLSIGYPGAFGSVMCFLNVFTADQIFSSLHPWVCHVCFFWIGQSSTPCYCDPTYEQNLKHTLVFCNHKDQ